MFNVATVYKIYALHVYTGNPFQSPHHPILASSEMAEIHKRLKCQTGGLLPHLSTFLKCSLQRHPSLLYLGDAEELLRRNGQNPGRADKFSVNGHCTTTQYLLCYQPGVPNPDNNHRKAQGNLRLLKRSHDTFLEVDINSTFDHS
jgi:hypothetical protein